VTKISPQEITELLRDIRKKPSYPVYQRAGARLSELDGLEDGAKGRKVRIAVLSSFTIDPILPYLQVGCLERNIWAEIFLSGFNQFAQQILTPESELHSFRPEVCFLHVLPEALVNGVEASGLENDHIGPLIESLSDLMEAFRSRCNGDLVVSNFSTSCRFPYSLHQDEAEQLYQHLNNELERVAKEIPGVHILNYDRLTSYHGKESVADERLRHIARMELGDKFLPKLANKMLAHVLALRGLGRKCVVLDLDNTLWGGVIGEDGPEGIRLDSEYPGIAFIEFQQALLALQERGILLAINSKNNESDAMEVLTHHPAMVLRAKHFSAMRINWIDKCDNIEAIARELNLALDSMVFIDDSPAEREMMRSLRPEVLTPEWPSDVVLYRAALESLCDLETLSLTAEDLRRGEIYETEVDREKFRKRTGNLEDYLSGLEMELLINKANKADLPRVHQLVHKTNQFNLTTRRYSFADIDEFPDRDDTDVYVLRNRDRFGDNGLVGVSIIKKEVEDATWSIDSLLMSCRVLGRTLEKGFLRHILEELKALGCRYVIGEFVPTRKNALVKDFYREAGFQIMEDQAESAKWILDLQSYVPPALPWLDITHSDSSSQP
jgi:FkbH-like protein